MLSPPQKLQANRHLTHCQSSKVGDIGPANAGLSPSDCCHQYSTETPAQPAVSPKVTVDWCFLLLLPRPLGMFLLYQPSISNRLLPKMDACWETFYSKPELYPVGTPMDALFEATVAYLPRACRFIGPSVPKERK
jgi:hypothetical protein